MGSGNWGIKTGNLNFQIHPYMFLSQSQFVPKLKLILSKHLSHLLNLVKVVGHAGRGGHVGHAVSLLAACDPRDAGERLRLAGDYCGFYEDIPRIQDTS